MHLRQQAVSSNAYGITVTAGSFSKKQIAELTKNGINVYELPAPTKKPKTSKSQKCKDAAPWASLLGGIANLAAALLGKR